MLRGRDVEEIEELHRSGVSVSGISAILSIDRKTVRKYLPSSGEAGGRAQPPRYGPRRTSASLLEPFAAYIQERLSAGVWNARVLLGELQNRGYTGKYTILTDYVRPLRQAARTVAVRRFETPPGHQAQVDWGILGDIVLSDGQRLVLSGFVMTLGYSRAMYLDISLDQTLSTLLTMHERAFWALGGIPRQILYDNMKTVVREHDHRGEPVFHPVFLDFASHYGFAPRLCRPYRPQTKGKVESGVGYIRKNFLCGRAADDLEDLRRQSSAWCSETANRRVHGTTGRVVWDAWIEEKLHLLPVTGRAPFAFIPEEIRRVSRDAFVSFQGNRYSVPWQMAGKEVTVTTRSGQLEISRGGKCIAAHTLCSGKNQTACLALHHEGIPLGAAGTQSGKARIHIPGGSPTVAVRPLAAYEDFEEGGIS
jgi:transposase